MFSEGMATASVDSSGAMITRWAGKAGMLENRWALGLLARSTGDCWGLMVRSTGDRWAGRLGLINPPFLVGLYWREFPWSLTAGPHDGVDW